MTHYIQGDIVEEIKTGRYDVVLHGCNCFCKQGAGVAKALSDTWPEILEADKATRAGDKGKLGGYSVADIVVGDVGVRVYNLYTQYRYGPAREQHFDIDAFFKAINAVDSALTGTHLYILMPKIGSGNGGHPWEAAAPIVDLTLGINHHITVISK